MFCSVLSHHQFEGWLHHEGLQQSCTVFCFQPSSTALPVSAPCRLSDIAQSARFRSALGRSPGVVPWIIFFLGTYPSSSKVCHFHFLNWFKHYCVSVPATWSIHSIVHLSVHEIWSTDLRRFISKAFIYSCLACFSQGPAFTSICGDWPDQGF